MEDEGIYRYSKRSSKPTKHAQFPKDSISSLPQELITTILVRLPVKYILQYKCVSKYWLVLISSSEFVKTHLSFSSKDYTNHRLLFLREATFSPLESNLKHCSVSSLFKESVTKAFDSGYPMNKPKSVVHIVGSVNGLICLHIRLDFLVLWNPSARKFKQLPDIRPKDLCGTVYGFGYDKFHDDYKIVGIPSNNGYVVDAKIYSLRSDSWRKFDDYQDGVLFRSSYSGKFVNGKLHWVSTGRDIMSIDLVDEKFGNVEQPCYGERKLGLKLEVLGSDFSVLCSYYQRDNSQITHADVWVMKDYGVKESWTKLYTIKFDSMATLSLFMSHKTEILILRNSTLTIYNSTDRSFRYPEVTDVDNDTDDGELYIESLISPFSPNEF